MITLGALSIGFAPIFAKLAMAEGVGAIASAAWRCGMAGLVLLAIPDRPSARGSSRWLLALPGVIFALDLGAWHMSFETIPAGQATLLANLQVVFVVGAGVAFYGERVGRWFWLALALAIGGVAVLVLDPGAGAGAPVGYAWASLTAVFYAAYILAVRAVRQRHPLFVLMRASSLVASALLFAMAALREEALVPQTGLGWGYLVALALVAHVLGQSCIAFALPRLPAGFAGLVLLQQPVFTTFAGWGVLGEAITFRQAVAGLTVLLGLELARRSVVPAGLSLAAKAE